MLQTISTLFKFRRLLDRNYGISPDKGISSGDCLYTKKLGRNVLQLTVALDPDPQPWRTLTSLMAWKQ